MIVVGGIGVNRIFGDVQSCRVADPVTFYAGGSGALASYTLDDSGGQGEGRKRRRRQVVWEEVEAAGGEAPEPRCVRFGVLGGGGWGVWMGIEGYTCD